MKNKLNKSVAFCASLALLSGASAFAAEPTTNNAAPTGAAADLPPAPNPVAPGGTDGMGAVDGAINETNEDKVLNPVKNRRAGMNADMKKKGDHAHYTGAMKNIPHTSISFAEGSAVLSESARASLRELVASAGGEEMIEEITVAAWSDKALPTADQELLDSDRELATKRAEAISAFLKTDLDVDDVDTYNMAERANWLARTFDTKDAELKSIFGKKGADTPVTNAEFQVIKNEGSPSHAMVVVERETK